MVRFWVNPPLRESRQSAGRQTHGGRERPYEQLSKHWATALKAASTESSWMTPGRAGASARPNTERPNCRAKAISEVVP